MISAPYINTGLFAAAYMNGQIEAVFCGHDHDNNFVGEHHGIKLSIWAGEAVINVMGIWKEVHESLN